MCQPVDRFELDLPDESLARVASLLGRLGAVLLETSAAGGYTHVAGHLPSPVVPKVTARLPDLTSGEGVLTSRLDHYAPVPAVPAPTRRRTGPDPLDRGVRFREVPR